MSITGRTTHDIGERRVDGVAVLCPSGVLDLDLAEQLHAAALTAGTPVVLDLTECVLVDPGAVLHLAAALEEAGPGVGVVCRRPSGRGLLRRARIDARVPLLPSVTDAVDVLAPPSSP